MAAMSDADKNKCARIFARQVYGSNGANCNHTDLFNAFDYFDDAMENTADNLPGTAGQTCQARLNLTLTDPVATNATVAQKGTLVAIWAGVKFGFITSGGD